MSLYAGLHALHAQAVIDYLLRACSLLGTSVETPMTCVQALQQRGLLECDEADTLRRLIRFRNIVVHQYGSIDVERVKRVVRGGLPRRGPRHKETTQEAIGKGP